MQGDLPFYDSPEDALKAAVQAIGKVKEVAVMLWGKSIDPEKAARKLSDCLSTNAAQKLDLVEMMFILRAARDVGCYAPFLWMAAECGYEAKPVDPEHAIDRVVDVMATASKTLAAATATLERMQRARAVG